MNRGIISKILALIIVAVIGYSVVWFFKTSSTKKYLSAAIASADGKISAAGVAVSGFPFSQKISIEEFKFQTDNLAEKLSIPNKYEVVIKKIEASSGLFSSDFKVNNIGEISFQDSNGNSGTIEFNQIPEIAFSFVGGALTKLSYKDAGYKINDAAKITLYEGGSSFIEFESVADANDKIRQKIKAEFKDVDGVDIFTDKKIQAITPTPSDGNPETPSAANSTATPNTPSSVNAAPTDSASAVTSALPNQPVDVSAGNLSMKKYFFIDMEYVLSAKASEGEMPDLSINKSYKIESINVKGLEISSPMYKITGNADFVSGEEGNLTATCNGTIKIEKISNIITYIKKAINNNSKYNPTPSTSVVSAQDDTQTAVNGQPNPAPANVEQQLTTISPDASSVSEADFATVIMDLAKKNSATMDNISIFSIKRDKGGEFMINETPLSELITKLVPAPVSAPINPSPMS